MNAARFWALVPAAGSSSRLSGERPKQYVEIAGKPLLAHTLKSLTEVGPILGIAVGLASDDRWWQKSREIIRHLDEGRTVKEISELAGRGERQVRVIRERLNDLRSSKAAQVATA